MKQIKHVFFSILHSEEGLCETANELFKFKQGRKFQLRLVKNKGERILLVQS